MRRVRVALTAVSIAALSLAVGVAVAESGQAARSTAAARATLKRYTDPSGWWLSYPSWMRLEHSTSGPGKATFSEATIANFSQQTAVHSGPTNDGFYIGVRPPLDANGRFPANGVAFRMLLVEGGLAPMVTVPDSRFPIELSSFRRPRYPDFSAADSKKRGVPPSLDMQTEADGQRYSAIALIGPRASPQLRAQLARVIASVAFPPLRPGTNVNGLTVLQSASHYPVGSFTLVHARGAICDGHANDCVSGSAPFYLVHAPGRLHTPDLIEPCSPPASCAPAGAFYGIGWTWQLMQGGYTSRCNLRLDTRDDQFFCRNIDARWDRVGRVITRPRGARFNDPLQFAFAKVAWDGHVVLVSGFGGNPPREPALRLLWPNWLPVR